MVNKYWCFPLAVFLLSSLSFAFENKSEYKLLKYPDTQHYVKWGQLELGKPASITYALVRKETKFPNGINCGTLHAIEVLLERTKISEDRLQSILEYTANAWSEFSGITIQYIEDASRADVLIGTSLGETESRAQAAIQIDRKKTNGKLVAISKAAICVNADEKWEDGKDGDPDAWDLTSVYLHEFGHVLGLDHYTRALVRMDFRYDKQESFDSVRQGDVDGVVHLYGKRDKIPEISETEAPEPIAQVSLSQ